AGGGHVDLGTAGAAGGGVVILRAGEVVGTGKFSAKGASADFVVSATDDGAGGGGAGGTVSVRSARALKCGVAQASGGAGGDTRHTTSESGPGGGGGGGVVFLQGESIECPVSVVAGFPGQSTAAGDSFGAGPSLIDSGASYGSEKTYLAPFRVPATPVLTSPVDGSTGVASRPRIQGTADPGVIVHLFLEGVAYVSVVPDSTGAFSYNVPADLTVGAHELRASAEEVGSHSPLSAPSRFDVATPGDGGMTGDAPVLVHPAEGEAVNPTPLFAGTSRGGVSVGLEVDGVEVVRVPLDEQRRFRYVLTAEQQLALGAHSVMARAWDEAGKAGLASPVTRFEVKSPGALEVGCGCGSSPGVGLGAVVVLLGLGAARLRRRA
ncbi:MAG TPA: hemagglutinin, partial [Hyalangium sp.]|nr:hemagglutinin [Hyalangium sp.]